MVLARPDERSDMKMRITAERQPSSIRTEYYVFSIISYSPFTLGLRTLSVCNNRFWLEADAFLREKKEDKYYTRKNNERQ